MRRSGRAPRARRRTAPPTLGGQGGLSAPRSGGLPRLQERLFLNRYLCGLLGFADIRALRGQLQETRGEVAEDGHTFFHRTLSAHQGLRLPPDQLAEYDTRILGHLERMNHARSPAIRLTYFQYLALLFTEIYLDRLFTDRDGLLDALNAVVREENARLRLASAWRFPAFTDEDLDKVAFWMATGSGKTLIMHLNLWQYRHYAGSRAGRDGVLLITPNEGLSAQHIQQFRASGIPAARHGEGGGGLLSGGRQPVTVIEITKLTENKRGSGLSVDVDEFEAFGLILVDEGHRGASGDVQRGLRERVAKGSFTFEYSATFGQIVNGASAARREELLKEYGKAILFDYSYPHFYADGYGKDYRITNLDDNTATFNDWVVLGNLLSYYEQALAFERNEEAFRPYNLEKPLWVFVGHSVTGRSASTADDRASLTDVEEVVAFFDKFLKEPALWRERIEKLLAGESGLRTPDGADLFAAQYPLLRALGLAPAETYEEILRCVFHALPGERLRAVQLKAAPGEIALRAGGGGASFGVINIGDVVGLMRLLGEEGGIACEEENIGGSLFESIGRPDSPVRVLIGSRKFMEGWDSFRVSSLGLMNIGRGEGSQIIQLFGRGVRLWGKGLCLKRSGALPGEAHPPHIRLLETLSVFGIRANYMAQFRQYLREEGIATDYEEFTIPVRVNEAFLDKGLELPRLREEFDEPVRVRPAGQRPVALDLRARVEVTTGEADPLAGRPDEADRSGELRRLAPLLDWDRILTEMLRFKQARGLHHLAFSATALRETIVTGDYRVYCPEGHLQTRKFGDLRRAEGVALGVLQKVASALHIRDRRAWEGGRLLLSPLAAGDPNLTFGDPEQPGHVLRVSESNASFAREIQRLTEAADDLYEQDVAQFPNIHFDRHLYQPLLLADRRFETQAPPGLNEGEARFVDDLRTYLIVRREDFEGAELFLLRNLTRGAGLPFFDSEEGEAFYPDFILWLLRPEEQRIAFIDPKGIRNTNGLSDHKVQLFRRLADEIGPRLRSQRPRIRLCVTSFILARTDYPEARRTSWVRDRTEAEMRDNHVLFMREPGYLQTLFRKLNEAA